MQGGVDLNHVVETAARRVSYEYKTQEHIHRDMADSRLLAIPTSRRRVAAFDPN